MNRELLRKMVLYPFQEGKIYPEINCTNKEKQFIEAFKKTSFLESKIQTLSFNFCESPFPNLELPTNIINADWLLGMGILHIYLESYLICAVFLNDSFFTFDVEKMENIRKYRNKTLAHIENFGVDYKSEKELIEDINYMVDLISKYMCELVNEADPHPYFLSYRWKNNSGRLIYSTTIKANTTNHLEKLYKYLNEQ